MTRKSNNRARAQHPSSPFTPISTFTSALASFPEQTLADVLRRGDEPGPEEFEQLSALEGERLQVQQDLEDRERREAERAGIDFAIWMVLDGATRARIMATPKEEPAEPAPLAEIPEAWLSASGQ